MKKIDVTIDDAKYMAIRDILQNRTLPRTDSYAYVSFLELCKEYEHDIDRLVQHMGIKHHDLVLCCINTDEIGELFYDEDDDFKVWCVCWFIKKIVMLSEDELTLDYFDSLVRLIQNYEMTV